MRVVVETLSRTQPQREWTQDEVGRKRWEGRRRGERKGCERRRGDEQREEEMFPSFCPAANLISLANGSGPDPVVLFWKRTHTHTHCSLRSSSCFLFAASLIVWRPEPKTRTRASPPLHLRLLFLLAFSPQHFCNSKWWMNEAVNYSSCVHFAPNLHHSRHHHRRCRSAAPFSRSNRLHSQEAELVVLAAHPPAA